MADHFKVGGGPREWSRRRRRGWRGRSALGGVEASGGGAERRGRCWVARGLGQRRRATLTAESARGLPPPRCPALTPAWPAREP